MELREIPLEQLRPSRNLRTEGIDVTELSASINELGLLQPIRVRSVANNAYQIIAGHRRFLAHQQLGRTSIAAVVVEESDEQVAVQSIVENLQREDLTPLELARGVRELVTGFEIEYDQVAKLISKSPAQVRTWVRLSRLPDDVLTRLESGEGRTQEVTGLAPRHLQPFVADLPSETERNTNPDAEAKFHDRLADVREFQREIETRGTRVNAHMADEIAKSTRSGQMTVREAIDKVMANPERYRYKPPVAAPEEIERDTFAAYKQIHSELLVQAFKLRPEIAGSFSPDKKAALLERLQDLWNRLEPYRQALTNSSTAPDSPNALGASGSQT